MQSIWPERKCNGGAHLPMRPSYFTRYQLAAAGHAYREHSQRNNVSVLEHNMADITSHNDGRSCENTVGGHPCASGLADLRRLL